MSFIERYIVFNLHMRVTKCVHNIHLYIPAKHDQRNLLIDNQLLIQAKPGHRICELCCLLFSRTQRHCDRSSFDRPKWI